MLIIIILKRSFFHPSSKQTYHYLTLKCVTFSWSYTLYKMIKSFHISFHTYGRPYFLLILANYMQKKIKLLLYLWWWMNRSKNSGLKYNMDDKIFAMPFFRTKPVVSALIFFFLRENICLAKAMLLFIIIIISIIRRWSNLRIFPRFFAQVSSE